MSDEIRIEREQEVQGRVTIDIADSCPEASVSFYLTSIYDHSLFEAFRFFNTLLWMDLMPCFYPFFL